MKKNDRYTSKVIKITRHTNTRHVKEKKILTASELLSITISFLALLFSVVNYIDVHRQLNLTSGQLKAYVQVTEANLVEPITDASFIKIRIKIKNLGQTAATDVYGEMDYDVGFLDLNGKGNIATRREFGSLGLGLERTVILSSNRINSRQWPSPSYSYKTFNNTVYFFGTIWYVDATTNEKRKEDWCYQLVLKHEEDLKKLELEQSTNILHKSTKNE